MSTITDASPARQRPANALRLTGVGRTFPVDGGTREVLRGVDIDLSPAEILAIVGASGCGKSTLLRLIGGLDAPTSGTIRLDGTGVTDTDE
ncbi:ATP-binding cassette domain-containing protein, partial [Mycobacterium sp.]|uniref:ATP-binding cassette domain-containing protein n=1 Tax=Mycobacterium sp. TaxID=1785 RepID=UPI003A844FAC